MASAEASFIAPALAEGDWRAGLVDACQHFPVGDGQCAVIVSVSAEQTCRGIGPITDDSVAYSRSRPLSIESLANTVQHRAAEVGDKHIVLAD